MNKKAFTIVELLAVIVILAIIALIAAPIVLSIINNSKESTTLIRAEMYLNEVDTAMKNSRLEGKKILDGTYTILSNGNICLKEVEEKCEESLEIESKGDLPKEGTIIITNGSIKNAIFTLNDRTIMKNSENKVFYAKSLEEVCKHISGTEKTAGAKYECKVDPNKDPYTFYILNYLDKYGNIITDKTNAVSVNLIMDQNINSNGTPAGITGINLFNDNVYNLVDWINWDEYELVSGKKWEDATDDNSYGPITAMDFLSKVTKNWTNVNEIEVSTFDKCDHNNNCTQYTMGKIYNIYARMPYRSEIASYSPENLYLYEQISTTDQHGYWTLSAKLEEDFDEFAWVVHNEGIHYEDVIVGNFGVRPVINLKIN